MVTVFPVETEKQEKAGNENHHNHHEYESDTGFHILSLVLRYRG
jgi:hypothetical protein